MRRNEAESEFYCEHCHDTGETDGGESCQDCCDHSDRDAYCCLICGKDRDVGAEIDAAELYLGRD